MSEEINFDDVEFGEPIEEREPNYRDGYIRGIYRARNIIDNQQKEIERLNNIINELEKWLNEKIFLNKNDKDYINGMTFVGVNLQMYRMFLDKLQELKGVDKE